MGQAEFGAALGVGRQTVKQWESGAARIPFNRAAQIMRIFEIAPESLLPELSPTPQRTRIIQTVERVPQEHLDNVQIIARAFVFNVVCQPEEPRKR